MNGMKLGLSGLAVVVALSGGIAAARQQPAAPATPQAQSMAMGQRMMEMHQQMMAEQQASLARLQPLLDKMNAAKGDAKVEAIAAVVNELVQ